MTTPPIPAAWYPDPEDPAKLRWWDGTNWTSDYAPAAAPTAAQAEASATGTVPASPTARREARSPKSWRPTLSTWIVGAIAVALALIVLATGGFSAFLGTVALFIGATGLYTVLTRRPSWLNLARRRSVGAITVAVAAVLLIVGAAAAPHAVSKSPEAQGDATTSAVASRAPSPTPTPTPTPTLKPILQIGYIGQAATDAQKSLTSAGFVVTEAATDGSAHTDWTGWTVASQNPSAGSLVAAGATVALVLNPPAPAVAPAQVAPAPAAPAPAPAVPAPAPVAPEPPAPAEPAPAAPAPEAPAAAAPSADVDPGGYCDDSEVGDTVTNSNGHSYTCGGSGADAKGHFHWNK